MKTIKSILVSLLFVPVLALAHEPVALPNAGLTPESAFYFVDKIGEALREFFTFNSDAKAHLQIDFAAERIAEIKIILETKGVNAKGLEVAQSRLRAHLGGAAEIVIKQKNKGKDVKELAKSISDDFDANKEALKQVFKDQKRSLEAKEDELKAKIREARRAGDTAQVEALVKELGEIKAQKELLELKEDEQEEALEQEEEKIEREMEKKEDAEKAIREAEEEKQEVLAGIVVMDGSGGDGLTNVLSKFDKLLAQAKELFAKENYVGAKQLAKQAEKSLDAVEDAIEDLNEAKEEELKEEQEERVKEGRENDDEETEENKPMRSGRTDQKNSLYKNNQFGFALQYPAGIRSFEETFVVDMAEYYYSCRWYDKGHEVYENDFYFSKIPFGPESDIDVQCSKVNLSFDEYIKKYFENLKASTARNARFWKISNASGIKVYGLFWEIPLHGSTPDSPQVGWYPSYSVLVDAPEGLKLNGRALKFLMNGGTRSCPNGYCETGETTLTCSADCTEGWDTILNRIFASFTFSP